MIMGRGRNLPYTRQDPPALRGQVIWVAKPATKGTLAVSLLWIAGMVLAAAFVAVIAASMAGAPQSLLQAFVMLMVLISILVAIRGRWALLRDELLRFHHFRRLRQRGSVEERERDAGNRLSLALAEQWPRPRRIAVSMEEEDHWGQLRAKLEEAQVRKSRSIIDTTFAEMFRALPLQEALVEPEDVMERGEGTGFALGAVKEFVIRGGWVLIGIAVVDAALFVPSFGFLPGWSLVVIVLVMMGGCAFGLRQLGGAKIMAGPGYITDARGRVWTVADSVMLIAVHSGRMSIEFLGPAGLLPMDGGQLGPKGLERLWQRWHHPRPRPELWPDSLSQHRGGSPRNPVSATAIPRGI